LHERRQYDVSGRPHGAGPPPRCPHEPDPFRVDVINGWPLRTYAARTIKIAWKAFNNVVENLLITAGP